MTTTVRCGELRLEVPSHVVRPWRFLLRTLLALAICAAGGALALHGDWRLLIAGVIVEGLAFVHMLELVHSCIHGTAFGSRRADQLAGVLLGLPMLVSFSSYRKTHLEHHRTLGKIEKQDFFGYEFEAMTTWFSFARHLLMLGHFRKALRNPEVIWLLVPLGCLLAGHPEPFIVMILPWIIAVPCHVLIELPEHWHCPPVDDPLVHTRSITASRLSTWFTNGNNFHLEHHLCPWLPNDALRDMHLKLRAHEAHAQPSYFRFYLQVARSLRLRA